MNWNRALVLSIWLAAAASAWGQSKERDPHLGYLFPAGGRQGTVVRVTAGGQNLRGADGVWISGEGVQAKVVEFARPLSFQQLRDLRQQIDKLLRRRRSGPAFRQRGENRAGAFELDLTDVPDHPSLRGLEQLSVRQLEAWRDQFLNPEKRQPNLQLAEQVVVEITIDADARPGERELRLVAAAGLTNPLRFQVGAQSEVSEREPNDTETGQLECAEAPVCFNGQLMGGDVDRFRFRARGGQQMVIRAHARRLIPYLADAVPGWFQATLALYDDQGHEVAFADDWSFDPDPVIVHAIPADGEFEVEIRDSLYRGREDFVYRISVGAQPLVTRVFPRGGRAGSETVAAIAGVNLPSERMPLDTRPDGEAIRETCVVTEGGASDPIAYAVDDLPERTEIEPNDAAEGPPVSLPRVVNGRIGEPGDVDRFRFEGHAGETVVAEVIARRLGSPLDSTLRLTDAAGAVVAWNDDRDDPETGLLTHHADAYLRAALPADGVYTVSLTDSQQHGGEGFGYRLRLGPPRPDFSLRITPSSLNLPAGGSAPFTVHVLRKDGFDGDVELALPDAATGFTLTGARIPRGRDRIRATLTAPRDAPDGPVALQIEGRARIGDAIAQRPVVPCEDLMQAFLYRHLVPAEALLATVIGGRRTWPEVRLDPERVCIPAGGTARVHVRARAAKRGKAPPPAFELELSEPPAGVTVQEVNAVEGGYEVVLAATVDAPPAGFVDNLILEVFAKAAEEAPGEKVVPAEKAAPAEKATPAEKTAPAEKAAPKKKKAQARRFSLGVLPALPVEIVPP